MYFFDSLKKDVSVTSLFCLDTNVHNIDAVANLGHFKHATTWNTVAKLENNGILNNLVHVLWDFGMAMSNTQFHHED
jgi:hypothetical protein